MEDPQGRNEIKWHPVTELQSKRIAEDQGDRTRMKMTELFSSDGNAWDYNRSLGGSSERGLRNEGRQKKIMKTLRRK